MLGWRLQQTQVTLQPTFLYRMTSLSDVVVPYGGIGPRIYMLETVEDGSAGGEPFPTATEQSTEFGLGVPLGIEIGMGPGAMMAEFLFQWGPLDHTITGDSNVGTVTMWLGYRAIPLGLRFRTEMDRSCSWWNTRYVGLSERYILEHEQIHFALFEIEVRALNASLWEVDAYHDGISRSPEAAAEALQVKVKAHLKTRMRKVLELSREFDNYTSMGQHPEEQAKWWKLVQAELAETEEE